MKRELPEVTHLNDLPTIIDEPGDYLTRDGSKATIRKIADTTESIKNRTTLAAAEGGIWKMFRGKMSLRGYNIWHVSGRYFSHSEDGRDIVEKIAA